MLWLEKEKNEVNKEKKEKLNEITRLTSEMEYAKKELGESTEEFRKLIFFQMLTGFEI